jgi:hypothetical protein
LKQIQTLYITKEITIWAETSPKTMENEVGRSTKEINFTVCEGDPGLFVRTNENKLEIILSFVDDLLIVADTVQQIEELQKFLKNKIQV